MIIVGHLASDPEHAVTKSGKRHATFPVATYRDVSSEGTRKEITDYHRVVAWGKLGDACNRYLSKGQCVYVEGIILNRAYEQGGQRRYVTEIRADEVNMLSWRTRNGVSSVTLERPDEQAA